MGKPKDPNYYKIWVRSEKGKKVLEKASLKHRTGLTPEILSELIKAQGGVCALCKEPFDLSEGKMKPDSPVVDHEHFKGCCLGQRSCSGCRRGIIHRKCNTGLGMFGDNAVRLRLAAEYLEKYLGD